MSQEQVNDAFIDRMVDGELSDQEQRQLLMACERHPDRWRDMALAYVESQTWRSEFSEFTKPATAAQAVAAETAAVGIADDARPLPARPRITPWKLLNVAAMLLLSLTVGYGIGTLNFDRTQNDLVGKPSPNPELAEQVVVWVPDQQSGGLQPMHVPVRNVMNLNQEELDRHNQLSSEVWDALTKNGHQVTRRRMWHPVQLKDGRGAFVPTDDLNVQFTGYQ